MLGSVGEGLGACWGGVRGVLGRGYGRIGEGLGAYWGGVRGVLGRG